MAGRAVTRQRSSVAEASPKRREYTLGVARRGLDALEQRTRYEPAGGRAARARAVARGGLFPPRAGGDGGRELLDRDPAPERDGRAAHGSRAERRRAGRADPLQPHERPPHEVDLRHRPRRHRDAGAGGEAAGLGGDQPHGAGPRGVRAPGVGVARALRAHDRGAVPAPGRILRLRGRALHARRGLRRGGPEGVRRPLREGADLPRQLHGQLGSRHAVGDLGPRGRGPRGHRHALLHRVPARGRRLGDGRHRAPGDDACRHRRGGEPRGRALPRHHRQDGDPAARRPAAARDRGRVREARVRHRRAEDHARARPERLRDRAPPRARGDHRDRRGRADDGGGGALCRAAPWTRRSAASSRRSSRRAGSSSRSRTRTRCRSPIGPGSGSSR